MLLDVTKGLSFCGIIALVSSVTSIVCVFRRDGRACLLVALIVVVSLVVSLFPGGQQTLWRQPEVAQSVSSKESPGLGLLAWTGPTGIRSTR